MRGTLIIIQVYNVCGRLIPTYAGNTTRSKQLNHSNKAHPHVCGEHSVWFAALRGWLGSSPRMRGTRRPRTIRSGRPRLIPTYAGNTLKILFQAIILAAHPHVCGEHFSQACQIPGAVGSSPRMRGTLADMGFYPHTPSFRISLEPKASINPTRFLGLSPSGSAPIPASFAPPFSWP